MATKNTTAPYIPQEEDPNSPYEGLFHLLRRCIHGHKTDIDSVCHYQDVFGHSCEEDHEKAAEGEYREVFYRLYEEAYGVVATINFDRKHSVYYRNLREQVDDLTDDVEGARQYQKVVEASLENEKKESAKLRQQVNEAASLTTKYVQQIADLENEVVRLKARLFDLMEDTK